MTKRETRPLVLIDEPTRYESLETWEHHLTAVERLPDGTPLKQPMLDKAQRVVAEKKAQA